VAKLTWDLWTGQSDMMRERIVQTPQQKMSFPDQKIALSNWKRSQSRLGRSDEYTNINDDLPSPSNTQHWKPLDIPIEKPAWITT